MFLFTSLSLTIGSNISFWTKEEKQHFTFWSKQDRCKQDRCQIKNPRAKRVFGSLLSRYNQTTADRWLSYCCFKYIYQSKVYNCLRQISQMFYSWKWRSFFSAPSFFLKWHDSHIVKIAHKQKQEYIFQS